MQGIKEYDTVDGFHVLQVHYTADPNKRSAEWLESEKMATTENDWLQEMEIDFTVTKGKPWYPEFNTALHVNSMPIKVIPNRPVIRGWDYGLTPATVFCQTTPSGRIIVHAPEIQSWESGILKHAAKVRAESASRFPNVQFYDYGDPAGNQRVQTDEKTCVQVLREDFGIQVLNGPVAFNQRDIPIRKALTTLIEGQAQLIIDPRCTWLIEALKGGYRRMEVNGEVLDKLDDNKYTHIVDALGYVVSMTLGVKEQELRGKLPKLGRM